MPAEAPRRYFYQIMGEVIGPVSAAELKRCAAKGTITLETLIRRDDHDDWRLADRFNGLLAPQEIASSASNPPIDNAASDQKRQPVQSQLPTWVPPWVVAAKSSNPILAPATFVERYFYQSQGNVVGPISAAELHRHAATGILPHDAFICREGQNDWHLPGWFAASLKLVFGSNTFHPAETAPVASPPPLAPASRPTWVVYCGTTGQRRAHNLGNRVRRAWLNLRPVQRVRHIWLNWSPREWFYGFVVVLWACLIAFGFRLVLLHQPVYVGGSRSPHASTVEINRETAVRNAAWRDQQNDAWVDQQVEQHWRPLPGGNSKADAKQLTKEIMRAKTWEELERVGEKARREGR